MANITWEVTQLECKAKEGDYENVVISAHWVCSGFNYDSNGTKYEAYTYGSVGLGEPNPDNFIPYNALTKDEVLNWVWASGVYKDETEQRLVNEINAQIEPNIVTPPLPWENTVET